MAAPRDKKKRKLLDPDDLARKSSGEEAVTAAGSASSSKSATSARRSLSDPSASSSSGTGTPHVFAFESINANARTVTSAISNRIDIEKVFCDAEVHFLTSDKASWVYHAPRWYHHVYQVVSTLPTSAEDHKDGNNNDDGSATNFIRDLPYSQWFDQIWEFHPEQRGTIKMYGRDVQTPRYQQAYDMSIRFSGSTFEAKPLPGVLQHCVQAMQAMLMNRYTSQSYLRGALLNWYANGDHYIGPHDDSDNKFYPDSPVFSLSLGATRRFVFTAKPTKTSTSITAGSGEAIKIVERLELELQDGDLVVMGGTTQRTHKHQLPKMKKCRDKRVSITLRCFKDP